jgi:hypothetical protein
LPGKALPDVLGALPHEEGNCHRQAQHHEARSKDDQARQNLSHRVKVHRVCRVQTLLEAPRPMPMNKLTKNITMNMKKQIFAIPAAANETKPNPKAPAINATTKKTKV